MTVQDRLFLRRHNQIELKYAKLFNRVLSGQYRQLAQLFIGGKDLNLVNPEPMAKLYTRMYLDVMRTEGYLTWNEYVKPLTGQSVGRKDLTDDIAANLAPQDPTRMQGFWRNLMDTYLNVYIIQRVTEVTQTTIRKVRESIERYRNDGLTDKEIGRFIQADARAQELRANTISRTETTNSISKAQILALESSSGNYEKAWVAIRDDRTRDAHFATDSRFFIPLRDSFTIGGYQMAYPGDSTQGSPIGNFINCRCRLVYREVGSNIGFRPKLN